jgi:small subunit ribosomal protein S20
LAHSARGWTGARTPSAIKRVRQSARRRAINQPRRTEAKTLVAKALNSAVDGGQPEDVQAALTSAIAALDRAAKGGVIHRNAANRRKSRLVLKVNAALGGEQLVATAKSARTTGKAAAAKQAKARIAAARATKAKGAQTAAGKARAAIARSTRETDSATPEAAAAATEAPKARSSRTRSTSTSTKAAAGKATPTKRSTKAATRKTSTSKSSTSKSSTEEG